MTEAQKNRPEWRKTACPICNINCGLEVQTGGDDGRQILKIRGDASHPASKGYMCEKSQRINYYQQGDDRLTSPMRRKPDGTYEAVDWDTAITEVAARLLAVKKKHGSESFIYYGGGAQGNHLCGAYGDALLKGLGVKYRSNALAQEKTGEMWVQGKMFGAGAHPDFHHCEVALFIGKNPWQSHGFSEARAVLNAIRKDPNRSLIVIDPRKSETAALADYHLQVKPGTDAWCLAALNAILIQENLVHHEWIQRHTLGYDKIASQFQSIDIADYAKICGVPEDLLRKAARRIASASSVAAQEDLGVQMNVHSTLNSYLQRLIWLLTGHYGRMGTANAFVSFFSLASAGKGETMQKLKKTSQPQKKGGRATPVTQSKIIAGLVPCNVIPEEILTDHPKRFRAMIIESGNPVHSFADSKKMREALRALDFSLVIDVAMTETARQADYVLPASSQFEKAEATFFNFEFPKNVFHVRRPLFEALPGTLPEGEIHARLLEKMGLLDESDYRMLRRSLMLKSRKAFALLFAAKVATNPKTQKFAPIILYRTLGRILPKGMDNAAVVWGLSFLYVMGNRAAAARAGFSGFPLLAADRLFQALIDQPSGVVYSSSTYEDSWKAIAREENRIQLHIAELMPEIARLSVRDSAEDSVEFPFILAAGERRSDSSLTLIRDSRWPYKHLYGSLRLNSIDAEKLGCATGDPLLLTTSRGSTKVVAEISDMMQQGHISLANGQGIDFTTRDGDILHRGVSVNELTDQRRRDPIAATPWHKLTPARLEKMQA